MRARLFQARGVSDDVTRHDGHNVTGPARSSPYPVQRLAPVHDLVDAAKTIAEADRMIGVVVGAKLQVIADQIRALQAQARAILEGAQEAAALHRAECRFARRPGHVYWLYRRPDASLYFSMLSPEDWNGAPPHELVGAYRLESDASWSPAEAAPQPDVASIRALVAPEHGG